MKNIFFLIFFIFSNVYLFPQIKYYKSNKSASPIIEISSTRISDFEYVLSYERFDSASIKIFYEKGVEKKRWTINVVSSIEYMEVESEKNKNLIISYYRNKTLYKEELFLNGEISEIRDYFYKNDALDKVIVKSKEGDIKYTNEYLRGFNGRLLRVSTIFPDGKINFSSYKFIDSELSNQLHKYNDFSIQYNYLLGKLISVEEYKDEKLIYKKSIDNNLSIEKYFSNDKEIWKTLDKEGRVISEITYMGYEKVETYFSYSDDVKDKKVLEKIIKSDGKREKYQYFYDKNDIEKIYYFLDTKLNNIKIFSSKNDYQQIVFKDEIPFIKIDFVDNMEVSSNLLAEDEIEKYRKEANIGNER